MAEFSEIGSNSGGITLRAGRAAACRCGCTVSEHGLKAGTLGYWNSRLKAQAADAPASSAGPEAAATFLAVHVAEPTVSMPEPRDDRIELALPGGCVVRVGRGFDAVTLDRLLDVVERRS